MKNTRNKKNRRPSLLGRRPSLLGWRPSLLGCHQKQKEYKKRINPNPVKCCPLDHPATFWCWYVWVPHTPISNNPPNVNVACEALLHKVQMNACLSMVNRFTTAECDVTRVFPSTSCLLELRPLQAFGQNHHLVWEAAYGEWREVCTVHAKFLFERWPKSWGGEEATSNKCLASSNRYLTSSNKKLVVTGATLLVTKNARPIEVR